jgi:hypothetical protein
LTRHVHETQDFVDEAQTGNSDPVGVTMPGRKWASDVVEPEPVPTIEVSSRDAWAMPAELRGPWGKLVQACGVGGGWRTATTYARARVGAHTFLNGNPGRVAHVVETVAVRFQRRGQDGAVQAGYAIWCNASDRKGGYLFDVAVIGPERFGWRALLPVVTQP